MAPTRRDLGWGQPARPGRGFFSRIQSNLNSSYKGRLLALILAELGRQEPRSFSAFLRSVLGRGLEIEDARAVRNGQAQFDVEWRYQSGRAADLAVLVDGAPIVLFEIKEDDVNSPRNPQQFEDYCRHVKMHERCSFVHLSRFPPMSHVFRYVGERVEDVRYRHLFDSVSRHESGASEAAPVSTMLREYLEDIGVNRYESISSDEWSALTFLVVQMGNFPHAHSLGKLQTHLNTRLAPRILDRLLGNVKVLAERLYELNRLQNGQGVVSNKPQVRFAIRPTYPESAIKKARTVEDVEPGQEKSIALLGATSATLYVYAMLTLRDASHSYCALEIGQAIRVDARADGAAKIFQYGSAYWSGQNRDTAPFEERDYWRDYQAESEAYVEVVEILNDLIGTCKKRGCPEVFRRIKFAAKQL